MKVGSPYIIIPYVTLYELDLFKKRDRIGQSAQSAIRWSNNHFKNNSDVKGQSYENYQEIKEKSDLESGDDQIWDLCLYLKGSNINSSLFSNVMLLTEDVNLSTKAILSNIKAVCVKNISIHTYVILIHFLKQTVYLQVLLILTIVLQILWPKQKLLK